LQICPGIGHIDGMPFGFLRGMLGILCIAFAQFFGRSYIRLNRGRERKSRTIAWALRTIVTGLAVVWRAGFDAVTIVFVSAAVLSFAAGAYFEWRPKHHEELDKVMFPRE
jgi:hypothetical protein